MNYTSPFNLLRPKHLITGNTPFDSLLDIINEETQQLLANPTQVIDPIIIYRGESQVFPNPLLPKIFRNFDLFKLEQSEIQKYTTQYHDLSKDQLRLLSMMQHDFKPTRLLDWSMCPKIALFFICHNKKDHEKDGVLYLFFPNLSISNNSPMQAFSQNELGLYIDSINCGFDEDKLIDFWDDILKRFDKGMIIPWIFPVGEEHLDHRANLKRKTQQGVHTFHPGYLIRNQSGSFNYRLIPNLISAKYDTKEAREKHLTSILIPSRQKSKILEELDKKHNINAKKLLLE